MNNNNKEVQEFQQYIIAEAKSQNKKPEVYVKELGEDGLKEAYKRFQAYKKKKAQKAEHGAKLQYFKTLKNQCAEDEQLIYYKRGGTVDCGCVKKHEEGGNVKSKKDDPVKKFKNKKQDQATRDSIAVNKYNDQEIQVNMPGSYQQKNGKTVWVPDRTKPPYKKPEKKCGGGFLKKSKITVSSKGAKVCPKCGKVHTGTCKYQKGGGDLRTAPKVEDRYKNSRKDSVAYLDPYDPNFYGRSVRRVVTPNNASIQREIYYPTEGREDTIYTEIPEHKQRLFFLPQVNVKPRKGFSYIKTPEYEILKRRFNTAWNLAK